MRAAADWPHFNLYSMSGARQRSETFFTCGIWRDAEIRSASYRPRLRRAKTRASSLRAVEQVREAGVRHRLPWRQGRLNPRSTLSPARAGMGGRRRGEGSCARLYGTARGVGTDASGKGRLGGRGTRGGDNGGAKPGDLQGARRLVGSLFQRQLPPGKRIARPHRRGKTPPTAETYGGDERPVSTANINRDYRAR